MTTHQAVRRWIMTGGVAAVTVTGTIYGAQLKGDSEVKKEKERLMQATPEERIAQLEAARTDLMSRKKEVERQIAVFHERRASREEGHVEPK